MSRPRLAGLRGWALATLLGSACGCATLPTSEQVVAPALPATVVPTTVVSTTPPAPTIRQVQFAEDRVVADSPVESAPTSATTSPSPPSATPTATGSAAVEEFTSPLPSGESLLKLAERENGSKNIFEIRGRIQAEAVIIDQDEASKEAVGDLENAVGFRRARLGAQGRINDQVYYVAEIDFAGGNITFQDWFVGFEGVPWLKRVQVGNFREPFSLEMATSSNWITFVERSPINSLDPARNWGVAFFSYSEDERWTLEAGAFRSGTGNNGNDISDANDWNYIGRVTCLPFYDDASDGRFFMHLGLAVCQQFPANDSVVISQGPQSNLIPVTNNPSSPFIPALSIPASQNQLYNASWALVLGSLSFQAEWSATSIDQIGGGPVFLHGCYAYVSLFLTGEHRPYVKKDGCFGMTRVNHPFWKSDGKYGGGPGAWEIAARVAYTDYDSRNLQPVNGVTPGTTDLEATLGVNWYLNDYCRLMVNWVHAWPVIQPVGQTQANGIVIRTAVFW